MVIVDSQGIMESVVIRESKDIRGIQDSMAQPALAGIRAYLDSWVRVDSQENKVYQVTLDIRVSRVILESKVIQDILDYLVYRDFPGLKVSVVIRESSVLLDTVDLKVSVVTQETRG